MCSGICLPLLLGSPPAPLAQDDWIVLPHPTTRNFNKLAFTDNLHGWVVGDSGTILMTSDGGASWATQTSPVSYDVVDIEMLDAQSGWALAQQLPAEPTWAFSTTVLRTTNGGSTWTAQSTFNELFLHAIAFTNASDGCVGGDQGKLFWTSDGGATWTPATVASPEFAQWPVRDFEFLTATEGIAMGGFYDVTGLVWRTTDKGHNWTHRRVAGEPLFGGCYLDSLNAVCVGGDLDFGAGMVTSSSGGADWEYTYLGIWGQAEALSFRTASEGWAPLGFAGTYMVTLDAGETWTALFTPDSSAMHDVVFTDSSMGYMAGDGGTVLKYVGALTSVGPQVVGPQIVGRPDQAGLLQNSPNPFHPTTRLAFRNPRDGHVTLTVYDSLGRTVATLVSEQLPSGTFTKTFDGTHLASGVYYYRLTAGSYVETRKMVLIR